MTDAAPSAPSFPINFRLSVEDYPVLRVLRIGRGYVEVELLNGMQPRTMRLAAGDTFCIDLSIRANKARPMGQGEP